MCKNKQEFNVQVERYRQLAATIKKLETELSSVKDDISSYVVAKGKPAKKGSDTLVVFGDGYKVSWILKNSTSFNTAKLQEVLGKDLEQYKNHTSYRQLTVS